MRKFSSLAQKAGTCIVFVGALVSVLLMFYVFWLGNSYARQTWAEQQHFDAAEMVNTTHATYTAEVRGQANIPVNASVTSGRELCLKMSRGLSQRLEDYVIAMIEQREAVVHLLKSKVDGPSTLMDNVYRYVRSADALHSRATKAIALLGQLEAYRAEGRQLCITAQQWLLPIDGVLLGSRV